jgi:hypothetical protein
MTLIWGIATGDFGCLISDTLLSRTAFIESIDPGIFGGKHHALKLHILKPWLSIGMAGRFELCVNIVAKFAMSLKTIQEFSEKILDELVGMIVEMVPPEYESHDFPSFLILARNPAGLVKLFMIDLNEHDGGWAERVRAYIGDQEPYIAVMKSRTTIKFPELPGMPASMIEALEVATAFQQTMSFSQQGSVGLVDRFPIRVGSGTPLTDNKMEYLQRGEAQQTNSGRRLDTTLSSIDPYSVAIYRDIDNGGTIFIPGDANHAYRIEAKSLEDFLAKCRQRFQVELKGVT